MIRHPLPPSIRWPSLTFGHDGRVNICGVLPDHSLWLAAYELDRPIATETIPGRYNRTRIVVQPDGRRVIAAEAWTTSAASAVLVGLDGIEERILGPSVGETPIALSATTVAWQEFAGAGLPATWRTRDLATGLITEYGQTGDAMGLAGLTDGGRPIGRSGMYTTSADGEVLTRPDATSWPLPAAAAVAGERAPGGIGGLWGGRWFELDARVVTYDPQIALSPDGETLAIAWWGPTASVVLLTIEDLKRIDLWFGPNLGSDVLALLAFDAWPLSRARCSTMQSYSQWLLEDEARVDLWRQNTWPALQNAGFYPALNDQGLRCAIEVPCVELSDPTGEDVARHAATMIARLDQVGIVPEWFCLDEPFVDGLGPMGLSLEACAARVRVYISQVRVLGVPRVALTEAYPHHSASQIARMVELSMPLDALHLDIDRYGIRDRQIGTAQVRADLTALRQACDHLSLAFGIVAWGQRPRSAEEYRDDVLAWARMIPTLVAPDRIIVQSWETVNGQHTIPVNAPETDSLAHTSHLRIIGQQYHAARQEEPVMWTRADYEAAVASLWQTYDTYLLRAPDVGVAGWLYDYLERHVPLAAIAESIKHSDEATIRHGLRIYLLDREGRGLPGVIVTVTCQQGTEAGRVWAARTTDGNGHVHFDARVGIFKWSARAPGYQDLDGEVTVREPTTIRTAMTAVAVQPGPIHPLRIIRVNGRQAYGRDGIPVLPIGVHLGEAFSRYTRDESAVRAALTSIQSAGWMFIRTWVNLNDQADPADYWAGRDVGLLNTSNYRARLEGFSYDCQRRGLLMHLASGGVRGLTNQQEDDLFTTVGLATARYPTVIALAEGVNEATHPLTGDADDHDPIEVYRMMQPWLSRLPAGTLWALSSSWEDPADRRRWTHALQPITYTHGYRGGTLADKLRHIFSLQYEDAIRPLGWQGEPPAQGASVTDNAHELDDEGQVMMAVQSLASRQAYCLMSGPGVKWVSAEAITRIPGFTSVPAAVVQLPADLMSWPELFHGGDRWADRRWVAAQPDVRVDHTVDGSRACLRIYGPTGTYRLRIVKPLTIEAVINGEARQDGSDLLISYRRGVVILARRA